MANDDPHGRWWNQPVVIAALFAALASLTVAFVGARFADLASRREVGVQFVGLAVEILQEDPMPEKATIRNWAVDVLDVYSGVPIPSAARENLIGDVRLPARQVSRRLFELERELLRYQMEELDSLLNHHDPTESPN